MKRPVRIALAVVAVVASTAGCSHGAKAQNTPPPSAAPQATKAMSPLDYRVSACGVRSTNGRSNVLLTIDDFPDNKGTDHGERMIDVAKWARGQSVMMEAFPIAAKVNVHRSKTGVDLVQQVRNLGTYVSNHTLSHPQLTALTLQGAKKEILGGITSTYLRPPYGDYNPQVKHLAESLGYRLCTWNIDTDDWRLLPNGAFQPPAELVRRVHVQLMGIPDGTPVVILGHYYTNYPLALQAILDEVVKMGNHVCQAPKTATTAEVPYPIC